MTETENIKQFLSGTRREIVSVKRIEELAEIPKNTLRNFLNNQRDLPDHHVQNIVRFLLLVGYQPINNAHQFL